MPVARRPGRYRRRSGGPNNGRLVSANKLELYNFGSRALQTGIADPTGVPHRIVGGIGGVIFRPGDQKIRRTPSRTPVRKKKVNPALARRGSFDVQALPTG